MIRYYHCTFKQKSPMRLSNGEHTNTDDDLLCDLQGYPFVPGSALTGLLREMLNKADADCLFGCLTSEDKESRVLVSDAVLPPTRTRENIHISRRDGVAISDRGTAVPTAKYDFEVVETGLSYTAVLEWHGQKDSNDDKLLSSLMQQIKGSGLSVGARTTRGYGRMDVEKITCTSFDLDSPDALTEWLDYDPFDPSFDPSTELHYAKCVPVDCSDLDIDYNNRYKIEVGIAMSGSFSVREKSTTPLNPLENGFRKEPDSRPLKNAAGNPVVPGTSWSGVFKHHINELALALNLSEEERAAVLAAFGSSKHKSPLDFNETEITGGSDRIVTRNALDRFTQAPRMQGGLFCSEVSCGGESVLTINLIPYNPENANDLLLCRLLLLCLKDMHLGLLSVGGEGSIGRGKVTITALRINGQDQMALISSLEDKLKEVAQ